MKKTSTDLCLVMFLLGMLCVALIFWSRRDVTRNGSSSSGSIELSAERGMLIAEYIVPEEADMGRYQVKEVWVEHDKAEGKNQLVIRLSGPHVDTEPRVQVAGLDYNEDYLDVWSQYGGPPYEVWKAPKPLPDTLILTREEKELKLNLKSHKETK